MHLGKSLLLQREETSIYILKPLKVSDIPNLALCSVT